MMVDKPRRENPQGARRHRTRRRRRTIPKAVFALSSVTLVLALVGVVLAVVRVVASSSSVVMSTSEGESTVGVDDGATKSGSVSFCAVGDNLINEGGDYTVDLLGMADAWSGMTGDGTYDFSPLYSQLAGTFASYDIAFINQETTLGGTSFDYQGFPSYNTPDEVARAVVDAGFDVVNCNTNHTYDLWVEPIQHAQGVWATYPDVAVVGSYASEDDREDIRVVERNGITIAFLSYSYGQNGYEQEDLPNDYYAVPFDKDKMSEEIARAKELADAVVVYMHWGDENSHEVSDQQLEYASFLASEGVDLTIGSHVHVIQPVEYVSRGTQATDESSAQEESPMLCVYGLGDFVSGYTLPKTILSGMFTCDFVRDSSGEVSVENPVWHGLVEHSDGIDYDAVYLLSDYTQDLAESNVLLARVGEDDSYTTGDPLAWAKETTYEVVGDAIEVEA